MDGGIEREELQNLNQGLNRYLAQKEGTEPPMETEEQPSGWSRLRSGRRSGLAGRNRQRMGGQGSGKRRILIRVLSVILGIAVCAALLIAFAEFFVL